MWPWTKSSSSFMASHKIAQITGSHVSLSQGAVFGNRFWGQFGFFRVVTHPPSEATSIPGTGAPLPSGGEARRKGACAACLAACWGC